MKNIPRYWGYARTKTGWIVWRPSPYSQDDAESEAIKAAMRISGYESKNPPMDLPDSQAYPYGVSLREKLLDEIYDSRNELQGFITRNHVGAEVLNVRNVLFLDWDSQVVPYNILSKLFDWFSSFFSARSSTACVPRGDEVWESPPWHVQYKWADIPELQTFMSKVVGMVGWSVRIYRTAAGYRGIATHALFDPCDSETLGLMREFNCDPLYIRLCERQESFRARLTPKGWRCGLWPKKLQWYMRFDYPCKFTSFGKSGPLYGKLWHPLRKENLNAIGFRTDNRQEPPEPSTSDEEMIAEAIRLYQEEYDEAVAIYEEAAAPFATCRYLGTVGAEHIHPEILPIIELHDDATDALSLEQLVLA